ncbi:MAG: DUF4440 domain-containing protein [Deltaproteobacteria bacterium]|nr:DUF4440 domain-containing protein [Deltaproteobacteria bacterium]
MGVSDQRDNHSTFERLWNDADVDGLLDLYEETAAYVASAEQVLKGHGEIRAMLEEATSMGKNRLELLALTENGEIALERTRWTLTFTGEDGESAEHSGLSTVVLRRQADGSWRMIIDDPGLA